MNKQVEVMLKEMKSAFDSLCIATLNGYNFVTLEKSGSSQEKRKINYAVVVMEKMRTNLSNLIYDLEEGDDDEE